MSCKIKDNRQNDFTAKIEVTNVRYSKSAVQRTVDKNA